MKQLTTNLLKVKVVGIDLSEVSKIEFAFSQKIGEAPLKLAEYPKNGSAYDIDPSGDMIGVLWTKEDTDLFESGKPFYMDTRITHKVSMFQPETPIVKLMMNPTLFEE